MGNTLTILFAEDDLDDYSFVEQAFKEIAPEYNILPAKDGKETIEILDHLKDTDLPQLIVLDYNMPRLDGLQTLHSLELTDRYKNIPKVIYSNGNYYKQIKDCLSAGALAFLQKGNSLEEIRNDIKQMLSYCN